MLSTSNLVPPDVIITDPRANARKITAVLNAEDGFADLYRKIMAGPSGQRADLHVGRVWYRPNGAYEFTIVDPRESMAVGLATRRTYSGAWWWSITEENPYTGHRQWIGYASSLSGGVDWCVNGLAAATGRHDSRRISPVTIRTADQVHAATAREHLAGCAPCRAAGQLNGPFGCVTR